MLIVYLVYVVDGDNDGKKDIWNNEYDVFVFIVFYFLIVGWDN